MSEVIPATEAFRGKVAAAVACGGQVPAIVSVGWGTGATPASVADEQLEAQVHSQLVDEVSAQGVILTVRTVLDGSSVPGAAITEVGLYDSQGGLAGRRVFLPKELEAGTELETTLELQF
jgi:hypothetical protein